MIWFYHEKLRKFNIFINNNSLVLVFLFNMPNVNLLTYYYIFQTLIFFKNIFCVVQHGQNNWENMGGPCYNTNTQSSFPNSWWSFLFSLKASKAGSSVWNVRPSVLKQIIGRDLHETEFLKIWSVKSTLYWLKSNLINLFNLYFINNTWR